MCSSSDVIRWAAFGNTTTKTRGTALQKSRRGRNFSDMKRKLSAKEWLDDILDWESKNPIAFASPGALREARLIEELEKARRDLRRLRRNGTTSPRRRRKAVAA